MKIRLTQPSLVELGLGLSLAINVDEHENVTLYCEIEDTNIVQNVDDGRFVIYIKVNSEDNELDLQYPNIRSSSSTSSMVSDVSLSVSLYTSNSSTPFASLLSSHSPSLPPPPILFQVTLTYQEEDLPPPPSMKTLHLLDTHQG